MEAAGIDEERVNFDLTDEERFVLRWGIHEWSGPARCTEELACAMGFESVQDLLANSNRLRAAVHSGEPLSRTDWCRLVLATEIVFASGVVGSGGDWRYTVGIDDTTTIRILRSLQRKVVRELRPHLGIGFGTRPAGGSPVWW